MSLLEALPFGTSVAIHRFKASISLSLSRSSLSPSLSLSPFLGESLAVAQHTLTKGNHTGGSLCRSPAYLADVGHRQVGMENQHMFLLFVTTGLHVLPVAAVNFLYHIAPPFATMVISGRWLSNVVHIFFDISTNPFDCAGSPHPG